MECYNTHLAGQQFFILISTLMLLPFIKCPARKPEVQGIAIRAFSTRREQSIAALKQKWLNSIQLFKEGITSYMGEH